MDHKERHIFIVSDSTGVTSEMVVKAALTQFKTCNVYLHKYPNVRTIEDLVKIMEEAQTKRGVVVFTLVIPELRKKIVQEGLKRAVPTIDILGPLLSRLQDLLEISPMAIPGLFRHLNEEYYKRIECIDYAVKHDDGRNVKDIKDADIVLVGVSRTSKTPISMYLAYRGYRTANIPVIYNMPLPSQLDEIDNNKVIGLTIEPYRLRQIRLARAEKLKMPLSDPYIEMNMLMNEVSYALHLFNERGWHIVDVTSKSIEEAATTIMELVGKRPKGPATFENTP